jgi:hypothetical protein
MAMRIAQTISRLLADMGTAIHKTAIAIALVKTSERIEFFMEIRVPLC